MSSLLNALPGAVSQGLIWGIMAIGLYITYKILELSDLTVDGSFCTGGAVCAMLMVAGWNVWAAMLVAFIVGMLTGWVTNRVKFIAPVKKYPGEHEMKALARGVMRVLDGTEEEKLYPNPEPADKEHFEKKVV